MARVPSLPRRLTVVLVATLTAAVPSAGPAKAATTASAAGKEATRVASAVRRAVQPAGTGASVLVRDATGKRTYVALRDTRRRALASNTKLFTAAAALSRLPALSTAAVSSVPVASDGVLGGDLVLLGGGDPSFGSRSFSADRRYPSGADGAALAEQLVSRGLREIKGSVVGDERRFDAARGGPSTGGAFDPEIDGVLGGLTWNRGRASDDGPVRSDPAVAAAEAFDDTLEARGVVIRGVPRADSAAPGAQVLGLVSSTAAGLVRQTLKTSDDLFAEALTKALAAHAGRVPATTADGVAAIQATVRGLGARVRLADGSGLSARSQGSARDVVSLITAARRRPWGRTLLGSLPIAGTDGTLKRRLTKAGVRGRCKAKTGNLGNRLAALSGTCRTRSGRTVVFSVLVADEPLTRGQAITDAVAVILARSRL